MGKPRGSGSPRRLNSLSFSRLHPFSCQLRRWTARSSFKVVAVCSVVSDENVKERAE
jgi:hypothetical protein